MFDIWLAVTEVGGPAQILPMERREVSRGKAGHQLRWNNLQITSPETWYYCPNCNQWTSWNAAGICPSFQCDGELKKEDPVIRAGLSAQSGSNIIDDTLKTVTTFAPTLVTDKKTTQAILREALTSPYGGLSYQTIQQLSQTQKTINESIK